MAVKFIRYVARRCIDEYDITIDDFYLDVDTSEQRYCSDRIDDALRKESRTQQPKTMRLCLLQATEDRDLDVARNQLVHLKNELYGRAIVKDLRYKFMVALAHEIKTELMERRGETNTARN